MKSKFVITGTVSLSILGAICFFPRPAVAQNCGAPQNIPATAPQRTVVQSQNVVTSIVPNNSAAVVSIPAVRNNMPTAITLPAPAVAPILNLPRPSSSAAININSIPALSPGFLNQNNLPATTTLPQLSKLGTINNLPAQTRDKSSPIQAISRVVVSRKGQRKTETALACKNAQLNFMPGFSLGGGFPGGGFPGPGPKGDGHDTKSDRDFQMAKDLQAELERWQRTQEQLEKIRKAFLASMPVAGNYSAGTTSSSGDTETEMQFITPPQETNSPSAEPADTKPANTKPFGPGRPFEALGDGWYGDQSGSATLWHQDKEKGWEVIDLNSEGKWVLRQATDDKEARREASKEVAEVLSRQK